FSEQFDRQTLRLHALLQQGHLCADAGERQEALHTYQQALHLSRQLEDKEGTSAALLALGRLRLIDLITFDAQLNPLPPPDQRALRRVERLMEEARTLANTSGHQ